MSVFTSHPIHAAKPSACSVAIIGVAGYVGAELCRLLAGHPGIGQLQLFHSGKTADAVPVTHIHPQLQGYSLPAVQPFTGTDGVNAEYVFLATPHETSASLLPKLLANNKTVIDLSGAFRLRNQQQAISTYGLTKAQTEFLSQVVYGLPEFAAASMFDAKAIAVPGCYVTAATLALKPLVDTAMLCPAQPLIINAVSGISGAGKKALAHTSFCEVSLTPYGLPMHRHTPEIEQNLQHKVIFTPHLAPYSRGILASCYAFLNKNVTPPAIKAAYENTYANLTLITLLESGQWPSVNHVAGTACAEIAYDFCEETHVLRSFCAIDNLLKGAAAQAVQCFNAQRGYAINTGLLAQPGSGKTYTKAENAEFQI